MKTMAIRINPGNLQSSEAIVAWTERKVRTSLRRFASRITRVEVHFGDVNGPKEGKTDLRCAMEARFNGRKPLAVEHRAEDLYAAIDGAARRLRTAMNRAVDRVNSRAHRTARSGALAEQHSPRRGRRSSRDQRGHPSKTRSLPRGHGG